MASPLSPPRLVPAGLGVAWGASQPAERPSPPPRLFPAGLGVAWGASQPAERPSPPPRLFPAGLGVAWGASQPEDSTVRELGSLLLQVGMGTFFCFFFWGGEGHFDMRYNRVLL